MPKSLKSIKVYEQQNAINKNWKLERYFITKDYAQQLKSFEIHGGDIIVSCAGTIGEIYELPSNAEPGIINQALMRIRVNNKFITNEMYKIIFINMIEDFSKEHSNGSAMKNIPPFSDLKPTMVLIPDLKEQTQIGQLFEKLDNLITLHQRKCDNLVNVKKALLEKMFPNNGKNVPELRFSGFTEAWEQRKVNDLVNLYEEKTTKEDEYPVLSSTMSGIYLQKDYFNQEVSTMTNKGYKVVPKGFITYRSMSDTNIFRFNVQDLIDKGIVSPAYPVFYAKKGIANRYFLTYEMNNSEEFLKQLIMLKEGGTRYALSFSKLSKMDLSITNIEEQRKISEFFRKLEHLITLHQHKLEKLKNVKKSLLDKMFV